MIRPYGSWVIHEEHTEEPRPIARQNFFAKHKVAVITGIVLFAIGGLVVAATGGILLSLKINAVVSYVLLGAGGFICATDFVATVIFIIRSRQKADNEIRHLPVYKIVTWNVGTLQDYTNMCYAKEMSKVKKNLAEVWKELSDAKFLFAPPKEEEGNRSTLFRNEFEKMGHPDIICLQETWQMSDEQLKEILPEGYESFTFGDASQMDCTVVWNAQKFSLKGHAELEYSEEDIIKPSGNNTSIDTIVLLQDKNNGTTCCVASAHLREFSLAYETMEEGQKQEELKKAKAGDDQARYDLETMERVDADFYIFAGDFKVDRSYSSERLNIIEAGLSGYSYDEVVDITPTIYDANLKEEDGVTPKAVTLDHIFVKSKNRMIDLQQAEFNITPLNNFERPSAHIPKGCTVVLDLVYDVKAI